MAFRKYSGVSGIACPNLAAAAWKLFHKPMNLPGSTGGSSSSPANGTGSPAGAAPLNMSPACGTTVSPTSVPHPPW